MSEWRVNRSEPDAEPGGVDKIRRRATSSGIEGHAVVDNHGVKGLGCGFAPLPHHTTATQPRLRSPSFRGHPRPAIVKNRALPRCGFLRENGFVAQPVSRGSIQDILRDLSRRICDLQDAPADGDNQVEGFSGLPTIHRGILMRPEFAGARLGALDKLDALLGADGAWSRSTIDDTVLDFVGRIVEFRPDQRQTDVRGAVDETVARFAEAPSSWVVDLLVYGFDRSCAGVRFGQVLLLEEDIGVFTQGSFTQFPTGLQVFARLETTAIDQESAMQRAGNTLDEHLMIINALCAREMPSSIQVSRTDHLRPVYSAIKVGRPDNFGEQMHTSVQHRRVPLTGEELRAVVGGSVGGRLNAMLAAEDNEFNRRVLLGYQFAGAASVDHHPERSFLMLAIALESAVLGKDTKSELTYQLSARVAHLIGKGLNGRKLVARTVNELYERRSRIVHTGQYGVSRKEAALMSFYSSAALSMLVLAPSFSDFTKSAQLEDWFKDRVLDGPNHYSPDPSAEVKETKKSAS